MRLTNLKKSVISDRWHWLQKGLVESDLDPDKILEWVWLERVEVLQCTDPKCWFFVSYMHTDLDPDWTVLWVMAGWILDKIGDKAPELLEHLGYFAKHNNRNYMLFNSNSYFLTKFLASAGEDQLWLPVKW